MNDQNNQGDPGFTEQPTAPAGGAPAGQTPPAELSPSEVQSKKILCGVLGILLGAFGVHKFILGYTKPAVIMLCVSIAGIITFCFLVGLPMYAMGIIGLVEGIIYLTKSDAEFKAMYLDGTKEWF